MNNDLKYSLVLENGVVIRRITLGDRDISQFTYKEAKELKEHCENEIEQITKDYRYEKHTLESIIEELNTHLEKNLPF